MSSIQAIYAPDTNVFIQAKNMYYAFDIAPCFWDCIVQQVGSNRIHIVDQVIEEIERGNDDLKRWVTTNLKGSIASTDSESCRSSYQQVVERVNNQSRFSQGEIAKFFRGADPWLIAYAMANRQEVVTMEASAPAGKSVQIPDVCNAMNVGWGNTYGMLRNLGVVFK